MLSNDYVFYSAYSDQLASGVSLLLRRTLDARVELVHVDSGGMLIVANIAVNNSSFQFDAVYAPNDQTERI